MTFFKNMFSCYCDNSQEKEKEVIKENITVIRAEVSKLKDDINTLFFVKHSTIGEIKRLEDKMNTSFAILTNKMDNVILILNTRTNNSLV
jgi:hypothetical protein